jgi:hypothetical protein
LLFFHSGILPHTLLKGNKHLPPPLPIAQKSPKEDGNGEYCVLILMQPFHFKMLLTTAFFNKIAIPLDGIAQSHVVNVNMCTPPPLPTHESCKEDSDGEHCFLILMQPPPHCLLIVLTTASTSKLIGKQKNDVIQPTMPHLPSHYSTINCVEHTFWYQPFSSINFC